MTNIFPARTKAGLFKNRALALYLAAKDPRTPASAKIIAVLVAAYALSPVDIIPDFIPFTGLLDDLVIVPFGLWLAFKMVPDEVMKEARDKALKLGGSIKKALWAAGILFIGLWLAVILLVIYLLAKMAERLGN